MRLMRGWAIGTALVLVGVEGCELVTGFTGDARLGNPNGTGGTSMHGSGGAGGGPACKPGTTTPCYDGPAGTEKVGTCKGGTTTCKMDGSWGACAGETTPAPADDCAAMTDNTCDGFTCGQAMWVKDFPDNNTAKGVGVDADGNVLVAGEFTGTINLGGSTLISVGVNPDLYVAKLDPTGKHLWSKRFGGAGGQTVDALAVDAAGAVIFAGRLGQGSSIAFGGGTLTASSGEDVYVAKLDAGGNYVWAKLFSGNMAIYVAGLAVDPSGNVIAVGSFLATADFGGGSVTSKGGFDMYVVKLASSDGTTSWARTFGDAAVQNGAFVAADSNGSVLVTGNGSGTVQFDSYSIDLGANPGVLGAFYARLDAFGAVAKARLLNGDAPSVAVDGSGGVFLTAYASGTVDFINGSVTGGMIKYPYVVKLDSTFSFVWGKVGYGGRRAASDASGNVIVIDLIANSPHHLQKLDPSGNLVWDDTFGTLGTLAVARSSGRILMAGQNQGTIDFGTGSITAPKKTDTFVVELAP